LRIENQKTLPRSKTRRFLLKIKNRAKNKGIRSVVADGVNRIRRMVNNWLRFSFWYYYNRTFKWWKTFVFQQNKYRYFYHKYNTTWRNERTVEIPIVHRMLQETTGEVLEVGNVLSHYFGIKHNVVDKYERAEGVITHDVTEIQTSKRYDLIISISTLEHVGWDENPDNRELVNDPEKILLALGKLRELLKPKGKIVVTVPLGYNPHLDRLLRSGKLRFDKQYFMKRASKGDSWFETDWEKVKNAKFNRRVPTGNAIVIGFIENQS